MQEISKNQLTSKKINKNGFTSFPTIYQLVPIIIVLLSILQFALIIIKYCQYTEIIIYTTVESTLIIIMSFIWWKTTIIDPTDFVCVLHNNSKQKQELFNTDKKYSFYCRQCTTFISNNAFHCYQCNRCTQFFDHHCRWLNNCIGKKNYFYFVALISVTEVFIIYQFYLNIIIIIEIDQWNLHRILIIVSIISLYSFPLLGLIGLVSFHIYLLITKKSTVGLILKNRSQNRNKISPENTETQSRIHFNSRASVVKDLQRQRQKIIELINRPRKLSPLEKK